MSMNLEVASWVRPFIGEAVAGDAAIVREVEDGLVVALVDVLGHGIEAHDVAVRIVDFLERSTVSDPAALMTALHQHLRGSRGAAAGICHINRNDGVLRFVGHGNTRARRLWQQPSRLVSKDGLLGSAIRGHNLQTMAIEPGDVLLFYSDGVTDRFDLDDYRHAISDTARSLARNVIEMFGKDYDDAACIAIRVTA